MNAALDKFLNPLPELAIDKWFAERGHKMSDSAATERRIVATLIDQLAAKGFVVHSVYDGEETTKRPSPKDAMELIFNLDEASLRFCKPGGLVHGVLLVLGNGIDVISDWNFNEGDADKFDAAMNEFTSKLMDLE